MVPTPPPPPFDAHHSDCFIFSRSNAQWPTRRCNPRSFDDSKRRPHLGTLQVNRAWIKASSWFTVFDLCWPGAAVDLALHSTPWDGHTVDRNWSIRGVFVAAWHRKGVSEGDDRASGRRGMGSAYCLLFTIQEKTFVISWIFYHVSLADVYGAGTGHNPNYWKVV